MLLCSTAAGPRDPLEVALQTRLLIPHRPNGRARTHRILQQALKDLKTVTPGAAQHCAAACGPALSTSPQARREASIPCILSRQRFEQTQELVSSSRMRRRRSRAGAGTGHVLIAMFLLLLMAVSSAQDAGTDEVSRGAVTPAHHIMRTSTHLACPLTFLPLRCCLVPACSPTPRCELSAARQPPEAATHTLRRCGTPRAITFAAPPWSRPACW